MGGLTVNPEHFEILKQGVVAWNRWRKEDTTRIPDLQGLALIEGAQLANINLRGANLDGVGLIGADLSAANFSNADLQGAVLIRSNLSGARFNGAMLRDADLGRADLSEADLRNATAVRANLRGANLSGANLIRTELAGAELSEAIFSFSYLGETIFSGCDLSHATGLEEVKHVAPSSIGIDTLYMSKGEFSELFLQGCGLSDFEISIAKLFNLESGPSESASLKRGIERLREVSPTLANPLFVSYSHADAAFAEKLESQLDQRGIRYWLDVHDLKGGRLETQIDRAIRLNPTVLLVLSERSVESDWVEWEASKARDLERELKRDVLCPIALDDTWKFCDWPGPLRRQIEDYHILDFSEWQNPDAFKHQFQKLIDGLGLFYPMASGE